MLGVLCRSEGRNIRLERTQLLGVPILRVSFPPGGQWAAWRLGKAARLLARNGVRRVLVPTEFDRWQELERWGLCGVDPVPLYRAMAVQLVLAELERREVEKVGACVALRGECLDAELARTAWQLCPKVRAVLVQVERGGERLTGELYREFGVGVTPHGQADLAVRFSGEGKPGELVLCGQPELLGLELEAPGLILPDGTEPLPLLTALWQCGRLSLEELRVKQ